ncbi:TetR/AcrR family transcriptional regulator [Bengtsoniella intestinalis]|uniref:TetR/AcrR family transcriptional regulator n=1 Tax=Bengtsoniella intestinalis TaxID=3073143 RepID=UPI00391F5647
MSKISQKRKLEILNAAYGEFQKNGIDGTSMSDIAKSAGIGKSTIYEYFPSKNQLLSEACVQFISDMEERAMTCFQGDDTIEEKMVAYCKTICGYMSMVEVMGNLASKSVDNSDALRNMVEDHIKGFTKRVEIEIAGLLRQGQETGEIRQDLDLDVAPVVLQSLPSMQLVWGLNRAQIDQGMEKAVDMVFTGLKNP